MRARVLLVVLALSTVAACGGSSGSSSSAASPASPAAPASPTVDPATQEITVAWEAFFKGGGTVDSHIALLEDGQKFRPELTAQAKDPNNAALAAHVTAVTVNGDTAAVTYDLLGKGGVVLLGGSTGEAAKVAGKWKVSKKTYCQLITLQDPNVTHAGCTS